jgi:hypothetical protein
MALRGRQRRWRTVREIRGTENSAALPLFSRLIPLIGRQIPLFGSVAEFASDTNEIKHLEDRIWSAKGWNQGLLLFFRVEQGNPVAKRGPQIA